MQNCGLQHHSFHYISFSICIFYSQDDPFHFILLVTQFVPCQESLAVQNHGLNKTPFISFPFHIQFTGRAIHFILLVAQYSLTVHIQAETKHRSFHFCILFPGRADDRNGPRYPTPGVDQHHVCAALGPLRGAHLTQHERVRRSLYPHGHHGQRKVHVSRQLAAS